MPLSDVFYEYPFRLNSTLKEFSINNELLIKKMDAKTRKKLFGISHVTFKNGLLSGYKGGRLPDYDDMNMFMNKQHLKSSNYILITSEAKHANEFNLALKLLGISCTSLYIGYGSDCSRNLVDNSFYELRIPPLTITQIEVDFLTTLVSRIRSKSSNKKFNLISDIYINAMSDKIRAESRYIDLSIILEILLLPNQSTELKYRFKLRLAKLLFKHYDISLKKLFEDGSKIYDMRSEIVHSGKAKKDVKSLTHLAHEYVQKLIWKYLEDETLFSEENLDQICLE